MRKGTYGEGAAAAVSLGVAEEDVGLGLVELEAAVLEAAVLVFEAAVLEPVLLGAPVGWFDGCDVSVTPYTIHKRPKATISIHPIAHATKRTDTYDSLTEPLRDSLSLDSVARTTAGDDARGGGGDEVLGFAQAVQVVREAVARLRVLDARRRAICTSGPSAHVHIHIDARSGSLTRVLPAEDVAGRDRGSGGEGNEDGSSAHVEVLSGDKDICSEARYGCGELVKTAKKVEERRSSCNSGGLRG